MRYAIMIKVSNSLLKDLPIAQEVIPKMFKREESKLSKKGKKVLNRVLTIGEDMDDIVKNLRSIRMEMDVYKKPRFIK